MNRPVPSVLRPVIQGRVVRETPAQAAQREAADVASRWSAAIKNTSKGARS